MDELSQEKLDCRIKIKALLKALHQADFATAGETILHHLRDLLLSKQQATLVGLFKSCPNEISTGPLSRFLVEHAINGVLPIITIQNELVFVRVGNDYLENDREKPILKQKDFPIHRAAIVDALTLDVIFLPGIAFDKQGHRLGRGQGHYDRALAKLPIKRNKPLLVGLAMDEQVLDRVPVLPHDVCLDYLCTPKLGLIKVHQ